MAAAAETPGPEAGRLVTSPSYEQTKGNSLKRFGPDAQGFMSEALTDFEQRNSERRVVGRAEISRQAFEMEPSLVVQLDPSKLKEGETLNPAVRHAAEITARALRKQLRTRDEPLKNPDLSAEHREQIEQDARRLVAVLIPTRSQDGRPVVRRDVLAQPGAAGDGDDNQVESQFAPQAAVL